MNRFNSFTIGPVSCSQTVACHGLRSGLLAFLSAILIFVSPATLAATSIEAATNPNGVLLDSLSQIETQSAKLGCLVARAIQANAQSFDEMNQAVRVINRETASLDANRQDGQAPWITQPSWVSLRTNTQSVLKAMETILHNDELALESKAKIQLSYLALVNIAIKIAKTSNDAKRVFHLMNAALVLERMSQRISQFTSNSDETETAAESLSRDMKFMESTIAALRDGNTALGIGAEPDPSIRILLGEVKMPMDAAFTRIRTLVESKATMLELPETSVQVSKSAADLASKASHARIRATF